MIRIKEMKEFPLKNRRCFVLYGYYYYFFGGAFNTHTRTNTYCIESSLEMI